MWNLPWNMKCGRVAAPSGHPELAAPFHAPRNGGYLLTAVDRCWQAAVLASGNASGGRALAAATG